MRHATATITAEYHRDGFVVVDDVLPPALCLELKAEAKRLLDERPTLGGSIALHASASSEPCRRLARDERILELLRSLLPTGIAFLSNRVACKSATMRFATPWHIDAFYWAGTRPKISVSVALDDADLDDGALRVVRGSHREAWEGRHVVGAAANVDEFPKYLASRQWAADRDRTCRVRRGGVVIFGDRTIHGTSANTSGRDRFTIIGVYHAPAADDDFDVQCPGRELCWLPDPGDAQSPSCRR